MPRLLPISLIVLSLLAARSSSHACTAFSLATPTGRLLAKSFDWVTGDGWFVLNERGRQRTALAAPEIRWRARHASLSVTTIGPGFPVSGMNEAGLAIEALVDLEASAPLAPTRGRLHHLELLQYGLDNFATTAELASFVDSSGLTQLAAPLHLIACDRSGVCATFEEGRVTRALPTPALANRPYAKDLKASRLSLASREPGLGCGSSGRSSDRFCRASRAASRNSDEALAVLESLGLRGRNQWHLVWNLDHGTLVFRHQGSGGAPIVLSIPDATTACHAAPRVRSVSASGGPFVPWTPEDAAATRALVVRQVGRSTPTATRLAQQVAQATLLPGCDEGR